MSGMCLRVPLSTERAGEKIQPRAPGSTAEEWKQNSWHTPGKVKEELLCSSEGPSLSHKLLLEKNETTVTKPSHPTKYPTPKPLKWSHCPDVHASTGCLSLFIYSLDPHQKSVKSRCIQRIFDIKGDIKGDIWVQTLQLHLCNSSDLRNPVKSSQPGIPCSVWLCCGAFSWVTLTAIVYFAGTGSQEETPFFPANEGCQD